MSIAQLIRAYHGDLAGDEHHRYRSWEHCYRFFRRAGAAEISNQRDHAALHLGFYLASWGMYRGSSFLLKQHTQFTWESLTVSPSLVSCCSGKGNSGQTRTTKH